MVCVSGCAITNSSDDHSPKMELPEMPVAGPSVAEELSSVCNEKKCSNIKRWLNELYVFREQYLIYKKNFKLTYKK